MRTEKQTISIFFDQREKNGTGDYKKIYRIMKKYIITKDVFYYELIKKYIINNI